MLTTARRQRQAGVTLIEMMTTISVAAVLASIAVPSFTGFLRNTEVRGSSESLLQGLQFARTEAIRRNQRTCFDWSGVGTGWIVSTDCANAPGAITSSRILQNQPNREGSVATVISLAPAGSRRVTFNAYGRVVPNTAGGVSITQIDVVANKALVTRRLVVSANDSSGRVFLCDPVAAAGTQMSCS